MKLIQLNKAIVKILSVLVVFLFLGLNFTPHALAAELKTANAIGPLEIKTEAQWQAFQRQLQIAKKMGIDAISTDIWWGKVEGQGDEKFDWTYYDRMVGAIESAGLQWAPIMAFHQCGTNVGDVCNQPIPSWIWNHFPGIKETELKYKSELGNYSPEVVSLWADDLVMDEYREFMEAFEKQYGDKAKIIQEINISAGTAGELRYPAYNVHDHWKYPQRGFFQAYSKPAIKSFRADVLHKYGDLDKLNLAWQTKLNSIEQINPPSNVEQFVQRKDYENTQYGRDFIDWYNQSLIEHGERLLVTADQAFDGAFAKIPFGMKIPGIHWQIVNPQTPRIAEITTGLIRTSIEYQKDSTARGYDPLISVWNHLKNQKRKVILHFTALEMSNGIDNQVNANSRARDLVGWVAKGAANQGVSIKGENALQGNIKSKLAWKNIENAFKNLAYDGFSALRLEEIADNSVANQGYRNLIRQYKAVSSSCRLPSLNIRGTNNNWQLEPMNCLNGVWQGKASFGNGANQRFKFDVYGDWQQNFGENNDDNLADSNGADILIKNGAGTYKIIFQEPNNSYQVIKQ